VESLLRYTTGFGPTLGGVNLMQIKLRVLFLGNSYTYFNNVPHLLHMLVESAREERGIETRMVVEPGFTLKRHWDDPGAVSAIHAERWDHVILQEQSTLGGSTVIDDIPQINAPTMFHEYARLFDHEIRKAGAKTVFFLTWARKDSPGSQPLLNTAYLRIAKELRARLAPVGMAWGEALKANGSIGLHQSDLAHPAPAGSYLAACVLYATLFESSPEGLISQIPTNSVGTPANCLTDVEPLAPLAEVALDESDARLLQRIAWRAVNV
jgi:hypothetical protein